jgi:hypothetical protein
MTTYLSRLTWGFCGGAAIIAGLELDARRSVELGGYGGCASARKKVKVEGEDGGGRGISGKVKRLTRRGDEKESKRNKTVPRTN